MFPYLVLGVSGESFHLYCTVELQSLYQWWLMYHSYFELVLKPLETFSITGDIILELDNLRSIILSWKCMLCVLVRIASMRYVVCTHKDRLDEAILMRTHNTHVLLFWRKSKRWPYYASWPGSIINPHRLNYPCLEQIFIVPKVFEPSKLDCILQRNSCKHGVEPDQTPHLVVSELGLHCLHLSPSNKTCPSTG